MKITSQALKKLINEAIDDNRIIKERPWSVEYSFQLSGGSASDSEGKGPDGFAIVMSGESGRVVKVIVDSYWNPTSGDESGNSLRIEHHEEKSSTYVPMKFDNGEQQLLIISNTPVPGIITVSHSHNFSSIPIVYLITSNPFGVDEDVEFSVEILGNGSANVKLTGHTNL